MSASLNLESVRDLIMQAVPEPAFRAFTDLLQGCEPGWELSAFLAAFTATARTLGRAPLEPSGDLPLTGFSADIAGRALLLCTLAEAAPQRLEEAVNVAYDDGDLLEKQAIVRCLALLPRAERFTRIALDVGRHNELDLFHALACHNPFPAQHYDELAWNKLYMKAAAFDLPLQDIVSASQRDNAELSRMALHYIEQQESAARTFPALLWPTIAAFPPPGAAAKMLGYASHAVAEQRLGAVEGLGRLKQARSVSFLRERLPIESDARVAAALTRTLDALENPGAR